MIENTSPSRTDATAVDPLESVENRRSRIRIKNRRQLWIERHPSYFDSTDLELADPLLYDRCVRRFQSAAEREADGRSKGYSGVLEADLYRSEAKLSALAGGDNSSSRNPTDSSRSKPANVTYSRGLDGQVLPEDPDEMPKDKDEGLKRWRYEMIMRFVRGDDDDFDYKSIDESDEWDSLENREYEEKWFDDEEPSWVDGAEDKHKPGETGIQDF